MAMKNIILSLLLVGSICAVQAADKKDKQVVDLPACCAAGKADAKAKACPADKQAKSGCCPAGKEGCNKDVAVKPKVASPKAATQAAK
jgi:hypothetical protein